MKPFLCRSCNSDALRELQNSDMGEYWVSCDSCGNMSAPALSFEESRFNWQKENDPEDQEANDENL